MISVNSHLQPKFFLKGFLAKKEHPDHADSIFVYKKGMPFKNDGTRRQNNPARTGLDNTAFVTNFYSFLKEDGTRDPQTYERRLEQEIENPGNQILKKLRGIELPKSGTLKVADFLSSDERCDFARYISSMYARTKRQREDHTKAIEKTIEDAKKHGFSYADIMTGPIPAEEKKRLEQLVYSEYSDFDSSTGRIPLPKAYLERFKRENEENESFPESIFRAVNLVEPIILKMKWQFRISVNRHAFFTGDDPVTWNNLKRPDATLVFPVSSNIVFFGFNNQKNAEIIVQEKSDKVIEAIRITFAERCREIYYSRKAEWLVDFFNKR